MLRERSMVVDVGWRTIDWVVTQSLKVLDRRSHAANKGMSQVVLAIAAAIEASLDCRLSSFDHDRIDVALRERQRLKLFGWPIDIEPYIEAGKVVVNDAISELRRFVQDASDIDHLIIAGGSAYFYRDALAKAFPKHELCGAEDTLFANVAGFHIGGLEIAAALADRAGDAASAAEGGW
jgi:plasmid segregation protein ParM